MKIKKTSILFVILAILMFTATQSVFALDNATSNENIAGDFENELTADDFSIPDNVDVNSTKKVEIDINTTQSVAKDDLTLKLNKSGSVSDISDFELENKKIKFDLADNDFEKAILHVKFKDTETQTTLTNIINVVITPLNVEAQYQVGNYSFKVVDADTGEVVSKKPIRFSLRIKGALIDYYDTQTTTTSEDGIATYCLNKINNQNTASRNANVGQYNITASGLDNLRGSVSATLTISKADVIITPTAYKEEKGSSKKFTIKVTGKTTGEAIKGAVLSLYIPNTKDTYYKVTTNNQGIGEIAVSGLNIGQYATTISVNDTNLNSDNVTTTITISKITTKLNVESLITYFNSGKTAVLKVVDKNSKPLKGVQVQINVDGTDYYYTTNKNGKIEFATSLDVGKHKLSFNVVGNTYTSNSISKTITIKKATGKFTSSSKTYYYNSGKYMIIKLTNTKNKKGIFNAKIHFKFKRSKTILSNYYGTTQSEGKIKFNINLKPGTYSIEITGNDSKNFNAKKITSKIIIKKSPLKITSKTSKKHLELKVVNKKSSKTVKGVKLKVKVFTGSKSKIFTSKSNSKGICNINLKSIKSGSHKIEVSCNNKYYTLKTHKTIKIK